MLKWVLDKLGCTLTVQPLRFYPKLKKMPLIKYVVGSSIVDILALGMYSD